MIKTPKNILKKICPLCNGTYIHKRISIHIKTKKHINKISKVTIERGIFIIPINY